MKAGLMEIADLFIVNKSDRPDATRFVNHLKGMLALALSRQQQEIPILQTTATSNEGVAQVYTTLCELSSTPKESEKRNRLLAERAYRLIEAKRMKEVNRELLFEKIKAEKEKGDFNLYQFANRF